MENKKLKAARKKFDYLQSEIADKAEISVRAYQQYESGKRIPNAGTAIRIAKALDSTVEELFQ